MDSKHETTPLAWQEAYREHLITITFSRLRIGSLLIIFIFTLDGIYQAFSLPVTFWQTFWLRVAVAGGALVVYVLSYTRFAHRWAAFLSGFLVLAVAIDIEKAILLTGGLESPFYVGLLLLIVGTGLFLPLTARQMSLVALMIWIVYIVPGILMTTDIDLNVFAGNLFFMITATAVSFAASRTSSTLRKREFFSQLALREEEEKSERLLLNILPEPIAKRLKEEEKLIADGYSEATVLFADIVGFTPLAARKSPEELVGLLNKIFSSFDDLVDEYGLEKIKTIGDAYMVAGGLPERRPDHANAVAEMALEMLDAIKTFNSQTGESLNIRIGINSGSLVAGVIGKKKFIYDLWGDTVNIASRMESSGLPGTIQVTEATYRILKDEYDFENRGEIEVKGKGIMRAYFLKGKRQ